MFLPASHLQTTSPCPDGHSTVCVQLLITCAQDEGLLRLLALGKQRLPGRAPHRSSPCSSFSVASRWVSRLSLKRETDYGRSHGSHSSAPLIFIPRLLLLFNNECTPTVPKVALEEELGNKCLKDRAGQLVSAPTYPRKAAFPHMPQDQREPELMSAL